MTGPKPASASRPAERLAAAGLSFILCVIALTALATPVVVAADTTVYRCGPPGSQWYSQIPCAEDSEAVFIKDQHLLGDSAESPDTAAAAGNGDPVADRAEADTVGNAEAFIVQLEKQRSEQLAEIDRDIARLQKRAETQETTGESTASEDENAALLASLQNTRESIVSEYDAMIRAAQQRVAKP